MTRRFASLWVSVALALLASMAHATEGVWIEAAGYSAQSSPADRDSARRRAVADALLAAALAGGAEVRGHTVVDKGNIQSDLVIVWPTGRVLQHQLLSESFDGGMWRVSIRALVGPGGGGTCPSRRNLIVTAYAPKIHVAPEAPAWTQGLAQDIANDLIGQLDRHPAIRLVRVTDRAMPQGTSAGGESFDFTVLTRGSVRLAEGEHGFVQQIDLRPVQIGNRAMLELTLDLRLIAGNGEATRQEVVRRVALPGPSPFGRLAELTRKTRLQMAGTLTHGLTATLTALLDTETCKPVSATLAVAGNSITVPVGAAQGLTRGSLAFTSDHSATVEMLEVVALGNATARLRPLDASRPVGSFAGRRVRFLEAGL